MQPNDPLDLRIDRDHSLGRSVVIGIAVCLLMLGVVFRAVAAGDFLWLDEQHTAWVAQDDLAGVAGRAADGNQTPLYFYAVWAAVRVGGLSSISLRLPSLICGLAMMVGVSLFVYRKTNCGAALLLVAAFFLLDYDAVFYASEARPYALVQLLGVIQAAVFFAWISSLCDGDRDGRGRLGGGIATAVLAAMIFYTHPTGMLLMIVELIFAVTFCIWRRSFPWRSLVGTAVLCGALILPGAIMIGFVWQRRENWTAVTDSSKVFGTLFNEAGLMLLFPLIMLILDRVFNRTTDETKSNAARWLGGLAFVACWAIIPKLLIASFDAAGLVSLAIGRYAIVGAIAFPLFAAFAIAAMRSDWFRWMTVAGIIGWMTYFSQVPWQLADGGFRNENWQQVVAAINAEDDALPVFLVANLIEDKAAESDQSERFQQYLRFPLTGIPNVVSPQRVVPRPSQGEILSKDNVAAIIEQGGGLVVVRDSEVYREPIRLEITAVLQENPRTRSAQLFVAPIDRPSPNNVHLFLIDVGM